MCDFDGLAIDYYSIGLIVLSIIYDDISMNRTNWKKEDKGASLIVSVF